MEPPWDEDQGDGAGTSRQCNKAKGSQTFLFPKSCIKASKVYSEKMCVKYLLYLLSIIISVAKILHLKGGKMNEPIHMQNHPKFIGLHHS